MDIETTTESSGFDVSTTIPSILDNSGTNDDLVSWSKMSFSNSLGIADPEVVYYESEDIYILFGGLSNDQLFESTLMYDMKTETWSNITPALSPQPRVFHSMIYDNKFDSIVLFGGIGGEIGMNATIYNDTWIFNYSNRTWTEIFPSNHPSRRLLHSMVYDQANEKTLLYGGTNEAVDFFDVWEFNLADHDWRFLDNNDLARFSVGTEAVYDSYRGQMIILGGGLGSGIFGTEIIGNSSFMDFWYFDPNENSWTFQEVKNGPANGIAHVVIYDIHYDQLVLYGGFESGIISGATWVYDFDNNIWYQQSSTLDAVYVLGSLAYNPNDNSAIYVGGLKINSQGELEEAGDTFLLQIFEPSEGDLTFPTLNPWVGGAVIISLLGLSGIAIYLKAWPVLRNGSKFVSGNKLSSQLPQNTKDVIKGIFGGLAESYYVIGANFILKKKISEDLEKVIPQELYNYKFLLHPMRLAMCRILIEQTKVPTKELRELMGVSWSDLSTHTRAMNDKSFIHIEEIVVDGKFIQMISLEPSGLEQYQNLTQILLEVIDESLLFDTYLKELGDTSPVDTN